MWFSQKIWIIREAHYKYTTGLLPEIKVLHHWSHILLGTFLRQSVIWSKHLREANYSQDTDVQKAIQNIFYEQIMKKSLSYSISVDCHSQYLWRPSNQNTFAFNNYPRESTEHPICCIPTIIPKRSILA